MGERIFFVYIITNLHNTTLYTGVTNNLLRRMNEHKQGTGGAFSRKYNLRKLVYFEIYRDINDAIYREKQLKSGSRMKKLELIESQNPEWRDLTLELYL
jgi:putative endonuclease